MQSRLAQHKQQMSAWASQLPKARWCCLVRPGSSSSTCIRRGLDRGVLTSLGLKVPAAMAGASMPSIGWNSCWRSILHGCWSHIIVKSIVKRWQQDPLWQMLTGAQNSRRRRSTKHRRGCAHFAAERIASDTVKIFHHQPLSDVEMTVLRHPAALQWGLPLAALIAIFWLSLFCYSAIPVSGVDAIRALLPGHTPTLAQTLVQNLRLPRLVAILIGANWLSQEQLCCKP